MTGVFEGVGTLQFTPDNKHAYAYSGVVNTVTQDVDIVLLEIKNNSEYLISKIQFGIKHDATYNFTFGIFFNDVRISGYAITGGVADAQSSNYIPLIIPPFTTVKCVAANVSASVAIPITCTMIAKVNGAIEQQNLESITDDNKWASL